MKRFFKVLLFAVIVVIFFSNVAFATKPFVWYKDVVLIEADGVGVTDIVYIPYEYIEHNLAVIPYYSEFAKKKSFMSLEDINNIIENILIENSSRYTTIRNDDYYGVLKVYLKNGRIFYVLMNTNNNPKVISAI